MNFNLFSVTQMLDKGYVQIANANESICQTIESKVQVAIAKRNGNLYKMMFRQEKSEKCLIANSIRLWHERLAHQNVKYVRDILNKYCIKYIDDWNGYVCPGCVYGKQHRISHPINSKVAENILDLIHVDLCEMNIKSLGGAKYFLLFKDDYSHCRTVYFLKTKHEAISSLNNFMKLVENQFDKRIKCLRSDNGTEIKNAESKKILDDLGVFHTISNVYTPQQNGCIEREMRTIVESACSAIHTQDLNKNLWAEAINYAVFTINQTGTSSVNGKSPAELWFGRKLNVNRLKAFGCESYVLIYDHKRTKIGKKSMKGIFVGYDLYSPCYRIYVPNIGDIVSSVNVIFNDKIECENNTTDIEVQIRVDESLNENQVIADQHVEELEDISNHSENASDSESLSDSRKEDQPASSNLRDRRKLKLPARFGNSFGNYLMHYLRDSKANFALIGEDEDIPISEALKNDNWHKAMVDEFKSLTKMKTWKLVDVSNDIKPLTCRWILRQKQNGRFKARLVVRGFEQKEGIFLKLLVLLLVMCQFD